MMKMSENAQKELIGGFDLLLRTNVQHIWEQIFLSLDYVSFRNCMKVSPEWNEVFHRKSFRAKIVTKFDLFDQKPWFFKGLAQDLGDGLSD